jgi:hypothetical protein
MKTELSIGRKDTPWRAFDAKEELMAHWQLLRTPVLRSKGACRVGCDTAFLLSHGAAS